MVIVIIVIVIITIIVLELPSIFGHSSKKAYLCGEPS